MPFLKFQKKVENLIFGVFCDVRNDVQRWAKDMKNSVKRRCHQFEARCDSVIRWDFSSVSTKCIGFQQSQYPKRKPS